LLPTASAVPARESIRIEAIETAAFCWIFTFEGSLL
jgi:hypothetical protein